MTGGFSTPDPERCHHYARFMAHLGRVQFDVLYWILFFFVIMMLFFSSWKYGSSVEKTSGMQVGSGEHRRRMKQCMYVCTAYASVSVVAVVIEVFALLALQFCDGEDLMALYWSTWTVMQVGGLIAMFGIMLACWNTIRGAKNPPWALALGTPVLVVAGIGHAMHGAMKKRVKKVKEASRSRSRQRGGSYPALPTISRDDTLRPDDSDAEARTPSTLLPTSTPRKSHYSARLVGYTVDGAPIVQFLENPGDVSADRGDVLGRNSDGLLTVAFKKEMTVMAPWGDDDDAASTRPQGSASASQVDLEKCDVSEVDLEKREGGQDSPSNRSVHHGVTRPAAVRIQSYSDSRTWSPRGTPLRRSQEGRP